MCRLSQTCFVATAATQTVKHRPTVEAPWKFPFYHRQRYYSAVSVLFHHQTAARKVLQRVCKCFMCKKSFLTKHPEQRDSRDDAVQTFGEKKSKRTSCDPVCHQPAPARTLREVVKCLTSDVSKAFFAVLQQWTVSCAPLAPTPNLPCC